MSSNPTTPAQWQEAVNAAHVLLLVESARYYGLITGGPEVNIDRCNELLAEGRSLGIEPSSNALELMLA